MAADCRLPADLTPESPYGEPMNSVDWARIPGPAGYEPARARTAAEALTRAASPEQAARAVADLRYAVSNDHRGSLYPAAVPAVSIFLPVIDTMPGSPREEAFVALLDWWGTFLAEPGFETYDDPLAGPVAITDGIMRQVGDAVPMLRRIAEEKARQHRRAVMALVHGLDAGWTAPDLPQKRRSGPRRHDWP